MAYYGPLFFEPFSEPNLSLEPQSKSIFRFIYEGDIQVIITLTEEIIIVKKAIKGNTYPNIDTTRLSKLERFHLELLDSHYPLNEISNESRWKNYYDSICKVYPELLNSQYYLYLKNKSTLPLGQKFVYTTKRIPISKREYRYLVNLINSSGYWKLAYETRCKDIPTDAAGFFLEANTPERYNAVHSPSCSNDTSTFTRACQQLIKGARMEKEINLLWNN